MTIAQLAVAEAKARKEGNIALADELQRQRWSLAMGLVVNSENTKAK